MQSRAVVVGSVVVVSLSVILTLSVSGRPSYVDVSGHVYERFDFAGRVPVAGVVVSNDWDSSTAVTNVRGEFRLRVRRVAVDEWIKFTARSGDAFACHRQIGLWKERTVNIILNEPMASCR